MPPSNQTLPFCFPRNGLCVLSSHSDPVSRKEYDLELLPVRIKPSVPQPPSVDQSQCTPRIWIYVCNCSLAIHINFVVSVGGFDVRENAAQGAPATRMLQTRLLVPTPKLEIPQGAPASLSACAYCRYSRGCAVLCGKSSQPTKLGVE